MESGNKPKSRATSSPEGDAPKESQKNFLRLILELFEFLSGERKAEDDPLNNPNEAFGALKEDKYKAELQLVDSYQSYVAELLRLSLLGIAVFGFLYKEMFADLGPSPLFTWGGVAKALAALGVIAFAVAAVAAIIFRFAATEGARYYIEGLRFCEEDRAQESRDKRTARAQESLNTRYDRIVIARRTKPLAVFALGLGGLLMTLSVALTIYNT